MKLITHTGSHAEGRWIMGGHYGRAGLGETAAHGGHRLGGQQPVEMKRKVDGVAAESGDAQKLRMRMSMGRAMEVEENNTMDQSC